MLRYGVVGILNTGVFALTAWLISRTGAHYVLYTAIAYAVAIFFSFIMNVFFTFRKSDGLLSPMFLKFILVSLLLLGLVEILQLLLIEKLEIREFWGVLGGMVFYTGVGYLANRLWVFQHKDRHGSAS